MNKLLKRRFHKHPMYLILWEFYVSEHTIRQTVSRSLKMRLKNITDVYLKKLCHQNSFYDVYGHKVQYEPTDISIQKLD
ncbi:MAG: hypothetical protein CVT92_02290 [Bacteroidetes bacterium HGW-Bacteroidetes-1]|jgi:hypothetical protein|nr:MAG: hypothetical protein CVT92_02290 [Bacteroidetes bacterium HGW-Bacteroidetes-1]